MIAHQLKLPPLVGADSPLNLFTTIAGPSGTGKTSANEIAEALFPSTITTIGEHPPFADGLPIGSGEGIAEAFYGTVTETGPNGKLIRSKVRIRHNALLVADEGQIVAAIGSRSGSTLLTTIRSAWSGATIGQTNASEDRRRIVDRGTYSLGVVMGIQAELAGDFLADEAGGTPGRFLWFPSTVTSPLGPDETTPHEITPAEWKTPPPFAGEQHPEGWTPPAGLRVRYLTVPANIRHEIIHKANEQARVGCAALDAHLTLTRFRVAGILAILEGRYDIRDEDWTLADAIINASTATRTWVQAAVDARNRAEARRRTRAKVAESTAIHTNTRRLDRHLEATHEADIERACAEWIAHHVTREPGVALTDLRRRVRARWRPVWNPALDLAVEKQWVEERSDGGRGDPKRSLYPGPATPS